MAVAAYASLVSLTHVLDNLHYRARFNIPRADINQVEALQKNVNSLLEFVELHSQRKIPELRGLWRKMAEAAAEAESDINFHVANLLYAKSQGETSDTSSFSAFCDEMETLIQKFCSIEKEFPVIEEVGEDAPAQKQSNYASVAAGGSPAATSYVSSVVVGLDEHVNTIRDKLVRGRSKLEILPIVGMGGIGKTTLAKSLYDDSFVVDHFDLRIWLTISQEYSAEQILKVGLEGNAGENERLNELGTRFYQKLFGRRYLIVMDDMWSTGPWDELRRFFPNDENGSRIMLTTRFSNIGAFLGSYDPYSLNFLDENESWDLFCQNAFSRKGCPYRHLESFAKEITKCCRGLPLEIVVVSRLLANSDMTAKYWENVGKNISMLASLGDDDHCMRILSLSYQSLPIHLKPCFLYLRAFPEDSRINVSELADLWIAEGFIKAKRSRSLEDIAMEYVKSLIDRNLIFWRNTNRCGIHDLLRDLCLREFDKECFLRFPRRQSVDIVSRYGMHCNLCFKRLEDKEGMDVSKPFYVFGSTSQVNLFVCRACKMVYSRIKRPSLVKAVSYIDSFDKDIFHPIELRRASLDYAKVLSPSTLHLLWNLRSLKYSLGSSHVVLPREIWEMPQLRDIQSSGDVVLPNPIAIDIEEKDVLVLKDLHTIDGIKNLMCTKEIIARIPNLKKLKVHYSHEYKKRAQRSNYSLCNLARLQKLESLFIGGSSVCTTFPKSLKELSLWFYRMTWEDMSIVGSLPSLEKLSICGGIRGSEWDLVEGQFRRLKKLAVAYNDLVCWRAEAAHFPVLEMLTLQRLRFLEEIPSSIGDILTLQTIMLDSCRDSVIDSAKQIWEEQYEAGNEIRIEVIDNVRDVSYKIGTHTARMTGAACESLAYLKCLNDRLEKIAENGRHSLNRKQIEGVEEDIHFLREFLKHFHLSKSETIEGVSREIMAQAVRKAEVVIRRLRLETLTPIFGKNILEDVARLLEKTESIKNELRVTKEGKEEDGEAGYERVQIDIDSLRIRQVAPVNDEDLREYQIGSVVATMTENVSLAWSELACVREVLRKAYELGHHCLNMKLMEKVEESIDFLGDVVEVDPENKIPKIKSFLVISSPLSEAEVMNSKYLWRESLEDVSDEEILSFSKLLETLTNQTKLIKGRLMGKKEDNATLIKESNADDNSQSSS
ncbi:putative late blight resistance protein homolog R1B-17 [Andrographis paniculata]|uniref:putative late blight resistance protein homolog R1B-17 n=1 Tax=Andrographis paniculata TaxID=175694 RepID=UPI0021E6D8B8|nr:putative late blight resistance protein homolog R1B-17 [Andrographis paniculata]